MVRRRIPRAVEHAILKASARRCALCYGLNRDVTEKRGQIAHINHDPSDAREDNLAFLCFDHHDAYDSTGKQSKSITPAELLAYRAELVEAIKQGAHALVATGQELSANERAHDESLFREADAILPEATLRGFLYTLASGNEYEAYGVRPVDSFLRLSDLAGKQFIVPSLRVSHQRCAATLGELRAFLSRHFFVYPMNQRERNLRYCLYPEHNIDRGGDGSAASMAHYEEHRDALEDLVDQVEEAYKAYREAVRKDLAL